MTLLEMRHGPIRLLLRPEESFVFYATYVAGEWDFLRLRKGDRVLDAGANIGDFTVLAARKVGPSGLVVAMEPEPDNFAILTRNIKLNGVTNVRTVQAGLWDREGHASLDGTHQGASLSDVGTGRVRTLTVEGTLREARMNDFDVIKMDIEGGEDVVFRNDDWVNQVREICVETHNQQCYETVTGSLEAHGFDISVFSSVRLSANILRHTLGHPFDFIRAETVSKGLALKELTYFLTRSRAHPVPACRQSSRYRIVQGRKDA
jgi:FkbM family methyltransferase